jgi:hypothetical protein
MHRVQDPARQAAAEAAYSLLTAQAVRTRAERMLALALQDKLRHFRVDLGRMAEATDRTVAATRAAYPSLDVPLHARWRHFVVDGHDRWEALASGVAWPSPEARARAAFDLAIVSVLLDAGAGAEWRYRDPRSGQEFPRSEGLALASLAMFEAGAFSGNPDDPLRADADILRWFRLESLQRGLQVSATNPLPGLKERLGLLHRLGAAIEDAPDVFARRHVARPGGLFDHFAAVVVEGRIAAPAILAELLLRLAWVWPTRLTLGGIPLGDCWQHRALNTGVLTDAFVPLHKLSQWLAYSLIEPLQAAGITVTDIDGLTGLAEYRNGGLFVDTGVLALRDPQLAGRAHPVASPLVVEWRALTVALLDRLALGVRERLGRDAAAFPLGKVLQGGSWAAGRALARERRADGAPPIRVAGDATVF